MMQLRFGTDGIRGSADRFPFTAAALRRLGGAILCFARDRMGLLNPRILVISDTRKSCPRIKRQLAAGIGAIIDAGVLPSPAALWLLKSTDDFDLAIVISASHNLYRDNGIKLYKSDGKFSLDDEQFIVTAWNRPVAPVLPVIQSKHTDCFLRYIAELGKFFPAGFLDGKKIVLDCANGATGQVAPLIFRSFGATVSVINNRPNGTNINENCGSTDPERLRSYLLETGASIGFAFDGDGDRLIAVTSDGSIRDGDDILAILSSSPEFINEQAVVGTIMTNGGLEAHLAKSGKKLIRTNVGDRHVVQAVALNNLSLGAEPSGHIIIRPILESSDGILAALLLCQTMTKTNNWKANSFIRNNQKTINIQAVNRPPLDTGPVAEIIAAHQANLPNGRIVVRYSGTEPLLRIMVEAPVMQDVTTIVQLLANELQKILN